MNSEWLHSFTRFAETCNFTKAAQSLHISQPALHVQIKKLSEELEVTLYRRIGRRLELTEDGLKVLRFARRRMEEDSRFLDELAGTASERPARLMAGRGAYLYVLPDALSQFADSLSLAVGNADRCVEALRIGEVDVAVAVLEHTPADMQSLRLRSVGQAAVVSRDHSLSRRRRLSPQNLVGETLILPPPHFPHSLMVLSVLKDCQVECKLGIAVEGWQLMMHFAKLGQGVAIVNDCCTVPSGAVMIPITGFPQLVYRAVRMKDATPTLCADSLWSALSASG